MVAILCETQMNNARENASVEVNDWLEPPVEIDMERLVGFDDDDEPVAAGSTMLVFNVQTDMKKPELRKGIMLLNSKVFKEVLRECAI